ncbi:Rrf2 family transcriptional regulator [Phaeodactylibacter luteus]|uniref:Rrf2 family transcriptional regulator n=2 Tax=Phaeodactylibacter luteus TaxID=1564516 RepID=A0A5C6S001_9BACT|nr:Rrf2 family transcriptional regulator [Phaeodactylibacter luteus]
MLSKKSKYAINALLYISRRKDEERPILASEIAEGENIPHKFLEAILLDLKNAGFLRSKRGRKGGYFLKAAPEEISLAKVMRLFDGPIALLPCVSLNYYERCDECKDEKTCGIRAVFLMIRDQTLQTLEDNSMAAILEREEALQKQQSAEE